MKTIIILGILVMANISASAQRVYTKNGSASFYSKATLENISAESSQMMSVLVTASGDLQFSVLIKSFHFKKSLMEEHFNENYLESDKYPKAVFKGKIDDLGKVNFVLDGTYPASVSGELTMHGVAKKITVAGTISVKNGIISAGSKFPVKLADYKISIPGVVKDNIAETVDVTISCIYDQKI